MNLQIFGIPENSCYSQTCEGLKRSHILVTREKGNFSCSLYTKASKQLAGYKCQKHKGEQTQDVNISFANMQLTSHQFIIHELMNL